MNVIIPEFCVLKNQQCKSLRRERSVYGIHLRGELNLALYVCINVYVCTSMYRYVYMHAYLLYVCTHIKHVDIYSLDFFLPPLKHHGQNYKLR